MKTSIATTLSVVGVLTAGMAAYAVNTSVLGAAAENSPSVVSMASTTTSSVAPIAKVTNAAVVAQQSDTNSMITTYKVGDAGSVVIDTASGRIVVTSILPAVGFTSEPARTDANGVVKVHFVSTTQRIEFIAKMENGVVVTNVINETTTSTIAPRENNNRGDDSDDDDDEYEDHHEDEDHHREDHEDEGDDD